MLHNKLKGDPRLGLSSLCPSTAFSSGERKSQKKAPSLPSSMSAADVGFLISISERPIELLVGLVRDRHDVQLAAPPGLPGGVLATDFGHRPGGPGLLPLRPVPRGQLQPVLLGSGQEVRAVRALLQGSTEHLLRKVMLHVTVKRCQAK